MKVTKNLRELCALLVDDIYGELPSRIFARLLARSRSTLQELCADTNLPASHIRSGLAILIQQSLLYHTTEDDGRRTTYYEANPEAAYNLIRVGKIIDAVAREYGDAEAELVQTLAALGNARLIDLEEAYVARNQVSNGKPRSNGNTIRDVSNTNGWDDEAGAHLDPEPESVAENLSSSLITLLESDILELCSPKTFTSPTDARKAFEKEVLRTTFNGSTPKGSKGQEQFMGCVRDKLLEARDQPRALKEQLTRKLEAARQNSFGNKKRKLANFTVAKRSVTCADVDPSATIRINYEKAAVLLRNQALVKYASKMLGHVTGQVYAVALEIIGKHIQRCRPDPLLDLNFVDKYGNEQSKTLNDMEFPPVTTYEIVQELPRDLDVTLGIGKAKGSINVRRAERVRPNPPKQRLPFIDEEEEEDDSSDDEADEGEEEGLSEKKPEADTEEDARGQSGFSFIPRRVGREKQPDDDPRIEPTQQHLLLLAESSQCFLRHSGLKEGGEWVVDFRPLVTKLRKFEVDSFIEDRFTRQGLRLVNILREKGKLDDKSLVAMAQMKKTDALRILTEMLTYGITKIQEVPKDNNRQAIRTIFLWFFEEDQVQDKILHNSYQAMLRCHQVLDAQRHKDRETLELFERSDVKGREEERLRKDTIMKYRKHVKTAGRLLNQIMRVDDVVATLRDF